MVSTLIGSGGVKLCELVLVSASMDMRVRKNAGWSYIMFKFNALIFHVILRGLTVFLGLVRFVSPHGFLRLVYPLLIVTLPCKSFINSYCWTYHLPLVSVDLSSTISLHGLIISHLSSFRSSFSSLLSVVFFQHSFFSSLLKLVSWSCDDPHWLHIPGAKAEGWTWTSFRPSSCIIILLLSLFLYHFCLCHITIPAPHKFELSGGFVTLCASWYLVWLVSVYIPQL